MTEEPSDNPFNTNYAIELPNILQMLGSWVFAAYLRASMHTL
jgi:hypothetical protein